MRRNTISSSSVHPFQMGHWFASYYQHYQCNLNLTHIWSVLVLSKNTQSVLWFMDKKMIFMSMVMLNRSIFLYIVEKYSNGATVRCLRETGYLTRRSIFMTLRRFFCDGRNKSSWKTSHIFRRTDIYFWLTPIPCTFCNLYELDSLVTYWYIWRGHLPRPSFQYSFDRK